MTLGVTAFAIGALALVLPHEAGAVARRSPVAGDRVLHGAMEPLRKLSQRTSVHRLERAIAHQSATLAELSKGLETALVIDAPAAAEKLYLLEMQSIANVLAASNLASHSVNELEHVELVEGARGVLRRVLYQKDHVVGPHALKVLRNAIPGELMASVTRRAGRDVYELLDRVPTELRITSNVSRSAEALYAHRWDEFVHTGGKASDILTLDQRFLRTAESGQLITWVHRSGDDKVWVSTKAKHIVTSGGEPAFGAGEMRVYRDKTGEIVLVLVSNASGGFKSGAASLEAIGALLRELGVKESQVLFTQHSPADPQLLKLLLVSNLSLSGDAIAARVEHAVAQARDADETVAP